MTVSFIGGENHSN